jgi:putative transposase
MILLDKEHKFLSIRKQCEVLSICRSNVYYKHVPEYDDLLLANEIHELWLDMPYYGYRKITVELKHRGHDINHKRVLRLMQEMKLQALYPKPATSMRNADHKTYPYLLRDLDICRPNQVWATDITYIKTPSGFMYLVGLIDIYSRFVLAWCFSNTLDTLFCLDMLDQGLHYGKPEILNTDQGCQFTSALWINCVEANGIKISMDGRGRWADNIIIERFWRTLKYEHVLLHSFETIKELKHSIGAFIDTYNNKRLHQSLGYKTPADVYFS